MGKLKYQKPVSLNAGEVASVLGANCSYGSGATDTCNIGDSASGGCVGGNDPQVAPVCQPGLDATYNCTIGTTNDEGNCSNGGTARGCYTGSTP